MFSIPLLLLLGAELSEVIALVMTAVCIQGITALWKMHDAIPWKPTVTACLLRVTGIPLGILGLKQLTAAGRDEVRQFVGLAILLLVASRLLWRPPSQAPSRWWQVPAFVASGFLAGLIGMGGPPIVLWVTAQGWQPRPVRGFLVTVFLFTLPANLLLLLAMVGWGLGSAMVKGLLFGPLVVLGSLAGVRVGDLLSRKQLTLAAYGLLLLLGLSAVLA